MTLRGGCVKYKTASLCVRFFKLFERSLLLFCECGSEFRFKPHNSFKQLAFVRAVGYGVFVRINVAVIQIFKCVHGFHPFPSQTPYHSPCRKSSTFQNKNDFLQNRLFFRRKSDIIIRYIMSKEDLTMANGNATIIVGSARLGSARLGRSIAPFFQRVKSYFIQFITNQLPETGRIMPWLRLFAFAGRVVV